MSANDPTDLIARGEYEEAARRCREEGKLAEAARCLAAVWRYPEAVELALASESPEAAYGYAVASLDAQLVQRVIDALARTPDAAKRASSVAELRGRTADAGALMEAAGERARAAELFEEAGELGHAARLLEREGELRRAGMLYERRLEESPDDAASALALGRILFGFGRYEPAASALQRAASDPSTERAALPWLLRTLVALDLIDAASELLERLRALDPSLPLEPREAARRLASSDDAPKSEASELLLGRYRVLRTLGAGASGRVLAAEDVLAAREVAVKVLSVQGGVQGRDALARFAREAQIAASIEHPNVVRVYDFVPDGPFLVMELMPGGTLEERLAPDERDAPLAPLVAAHVAGSILRALDVVHRRGVVHRDLKPANVFFGAAGEVKVGDFGVAHLTDAGTTRTGAMMGTLGYMAPEQITGDGNPDASTDLYAFGVILYRMLVGALPFPGPDFLTQHLSAPIPRPSEHASWLEADFDPPILKLLAKDRRDRFATASEAFDALSKLPFARAGERFERRAPAPLDAPSAAASEARSAEHAPSSSERYAPKERFVRGALAFTRGVDTLLERPVWLLEDASDALRAHYRRFARVVSPHVQAVLAVDDDARLVVLEAPGGAPAERTPIALDRMPDVGSALDALEQAGLHHGAIAASELVLGEARAVLLLPSAASERSIDEDRRAVAALFGAR